MFYALMTTSGICRYSSTLRSTAHVKELNVMTDSFQRAQQSELNRRQSARTFECSRSSPSRRRARRAHLFDEVFWQRADAPNYRRGILVGFSATGVALITDHDCAVRAGMQITPSKKGRNGHWRKPVVVTRVDRLSDILDLVAAEYTCTSPAMD